MALELQVVAGGSASSGSGASAPAAQGGAGEASRGSQNVLGFLGIGVIAIAVLAAVVYPFTKHRLASQPVGRPRLTVEPRARRLVAELADLEEAREAGELDQLSYERQRAETYEAIRSLWD